MKKRSFILLFIVGLVGLFLPRDTFAENSFTSRLFMDYRFFVENQDEEDLDTLHFKLHDVNNIISFDSEYDPESKAYYFLGDNILNGGQGVVNGERILPSDLLTDLKKINISYENFGVEYMNALNSISSKYSSVEVIKNGYMMPMNSLYLPFVLEEVNHQGDGEPIKKTVFSMINIYQSYTNKFSIDIYLINNSCVYIKNGYFDGAPDDYMNFWVDKISFIRKNALDYDENFTNQYLSLQVATTEIQNDNYLNKGFLNDKFSTGEIASSGVSFNGKEIGAVKLRNSSDNLKEELLKDYCDCLPVFVQARKAPSIVEVITNPKTFTTGVMVLAVSLLLALGFVAFILTNQKKSDNEA